MNYATIILTFVMLWWLLFFIALPIGVQRDDKPQIGNAISAPKEAQLFIKSLCVTVMAFLLTFAFFSLLEHGYLDFLSPR